ncbi:hypothetical protein [Streptomyces sp. NPDC087437]|uniref:hypothetical protein n=1 Tax=Streptomyces sp. NPDC087437 TaxID=3365789 RepID=UPI0037F636C3
MDQGRTGPKPDRALARLGHAVAGEWQSTTGQARDVPVFRVEVRAHVPGESRSEWQLVRDTDGDEVTVTLIASADGQRVSVQGGTGETFHGERARQAGGGRARPGVSSPRLPACRRTRHPLSTRPCFIGVHL